MRHKKEGNIDVGFKSVEIRKRHVVHTSRGAVIMEDALHICAAIFDLVEPLHHYWPQYWRFGLQPFFHGDLLNVFVCVAEQLERHGFHRGDQQ